MQAVLALPAVADQRRLGQQRQFFGIVERESQAICSVPNTQVPPRGLVDGLGVDPRSGERSEPLFGRPRELSGSVTLAPPDG